MATFHPALIETLQNRLRNTGPAEIFRVNASKAIPIIDKGTGEVYVQSVPKQLLLFFCPESIIHSYLRNIKGTHGCQRIEIPSKWCEAPGLQYVINWMREASQNPYGAIELRAPFHLSLAISISRALRCFGLVRDGIRVDDFIYRTWFKIPLQPAQVIELWTRFPQDYKYNHHAIENVRYTLRSQDPRHQGVKTDLLEYMTRADPDFVSRVNNRGENNRFRPEQQGHRQRRLAHAARTAQQDGNFNTEPEVSPLVARPRYPPPTSVHRPRESEDTEFEERRDSAHPRTHNFQSIPVPATTASDSATLIDKLLAESAGAMRVEGERYYCDDDMKLMKDERIEALCPEVDQEPWMRPRSWSFELKVKERRAKEAAHPDLYKRKLRDYILF